MDLVRELPVEVLAAARQPLYAPAVDRRRQLLGRRGLAPARVEHLDPLEHAPLDRGREVASDRLDLGQFGHVIEGSAVIMRPVVIAADLDVVRLGSGPRVVLVHGSIVDARRTWRHQLGLAERWSLCVPNRPGFGASPPLGRGDFALEAPLIAELLEDGAHLVGHSYGAVIALLAAAQRPDAVRSLTVSEPGALRIARGDPDVDAVIAQGDELYRLRDSISRPWRPTSSTPPVRGTRSRRDSCSAAPAKRPPGVGCTRRRAASRK